VPPYLERFVGYALDKAGDKKAALAYFQELRRTMGENPDPARQPEVVEREMQRLTKELRTSPNGKRP